MKVKLRLPGMTQWGCVWERVKMSDTWKIADKVERENQKETGERKHTSFTAIFLVTLSNFAWNITRHEKQRIVGKTIARSKGEHLKFWVWDMVIKLPKCFILLFYWQKNTSSILFISPLFHFKKVFFFAKFQISIIYLSGLWLLYKWLKSERNVDPSCIWNSTSKFCSGLKKSIQHASCSVWVYSSKYWVNWNPVLSDSEPNFMVINTTVHKISFKTSNTPMVGKYNCQKLTKSINLHRGWEINFLKMWSSTS